MNTVQGTNYEMDTPIVESIYLKDNSGKLRDTVLEEISQEQVDMYRNYYGDLGTQVLDIKNQYQSKLETVKESKEKETLLKERDKKIDDVVQNFKDDNIVKNKIIEEEKSYIETNKKEIATDSKSYLNTANEYFYYYFKDTQTGDVYTNINGLTKYASNDEIKDKLKSIGMGKIYQREYSMDFYTFIKEEVRNQGLFHSTRVTLKGSYIISKESSLAKEWAKQEEDKALFSKLIYVGLFSMLIGIGILYMYINTSITYKWMKKLPIDIAIIIFLVGGFIAAFLGTSIYPYNLGGINTLRMLVPPVLAGCLLITISFISFKIIWHKLLPKYKEKDTLFVFKDSLIYRTLDFSKKKFQRLSVGIKVIIILLLEIFTIILLLIFLNAYMGSVNRLITGIILITLITFEIKVNVRVIKKIKHIMKQPKKWLREYEQETTKEVSLDEFYNELIKLNELIEMSQKDTMQSEMLKTELLTNVSHDLRTPLTSIITYGDLLKQESLTDDNRKEYVEIINKKAHRMKHLIDDLFEVTKMNNGEIVLDKSEVNLTQLLQQSVSEYSEEFEDHHLKFIFNKPEEAINLPLDGERMWRVFDNIFGNAIKYSMPETRVYLKLEKRNDMSKIELKNISQHELNEEADQLMEKFKRGDSSRHTEGSGLGLAIINSIVSLHDGNIDIQVDGDLFKLTIYLPLH